MEEARDRFFSKVNKTETCWLWTGTMLVAGYGKIRITKKYILAHRASWLLVGNTIPEGHVVRHKCRNRHCVNPEHLETGTVAENNSDMIRDGTSTRGEKSGNVKLTEDQVRAIRANTENKTQQELGEKYGVGSRAISKIILRQRWKHLE